MGGIRECLLPPLLRLPVGNEEGARRREVGRNQPSTPRQESFAESALYQSLTKLWRKSTRASLPIPIVLAKAPLKIS